MMNYKAIICEYLYMVLDSYGSSYSIVVVGCFQGFLGHSGVITERILDSSPTFFYESLDSPST
jgi:hypothetical protein